MRKRIILFVGAWLCALGSVTAGGFQVNLQAVPNAGMGHVGAALAFDPSAQFFNPGALGMVQTGLSLGTTPIFARVAYREPAPGVYTTNNEATISTPFAGYGAVRTNIFDNTPVVFGVGVYTPFGSRVLYADDWKGQFALREISLQTIFIQPTIAVNFGERFSVGFGPVFATGSVSLRRAVPAQFTNGNYGEVLLSGAGRGFGFNAGIYYQSDQKDFSAGVSFRSSVGFNADDGTAEFAVPASLADSFPNTTFSAQIDLPWTLTVGAAYRFPGKNLVSVDINYVGWSVYQSLDFDFVQNTSLLDDLASPRNYTNAFIFRAGWQKDLTDDFQVRAGAYYDMTPVPDGFTTPETPDSDKIGLNAGASYHLGRLRIDASLSWVEAQERTDINQELNFGGTYKARGFIPGLALCYTFAPKYDAVIDPSR
ncbi:MAG: outer membrane protein transport protein [Bacteroidota bacterium]